METLKNLMSKRLLNIPVLYWTFAAAIIFLVVALKLKPFGPKADETTGSDTKDGDSAGLAPTPNPYDSLDPDGKGTVTVIQQPAPTKEEETTIKTNDAWIREGAEWLTAKKEVPGSQGLSALTKFINGQDRSYNEQIWVDQVIAEKGQPPDGVTATGKVGYKPAQKQFTNFPGKHTVKGGSDNTYGDLATLYYGHNDQPAYDLIQANNPQLGLQGPFSVGTVVNIPAYRTPVYYTVTASSMTINQIAAKNGTSVYAISALNNTSKTTWSKGSKVRVK
jgi:hypothetical protein